MRSPGKLALGIALTLAVASVWLYAIGMHPAHPVTTVLHAPAKARRLLVFVKGGSADLESYRPLLTRLRREPALAGADCSSSIIGWRA